MSHSERLQELERLLKIPAFRAPNEVPIIGLGEIVAAEPALRRVITKIMEKRQVAAEALLGEIMAMSIGGNEGGDLLRLRQQLEARLPDDEKLKLISIRGEV